MKKLTGFLLVCLLLLGVTFTVSAYHVGEVINKAVYTDIVASINDYNITSFNVDGYTMVVAEDLRNYGFNVEWRPEEKALYITRAATNNVAATYIAPEITPGMVGVKAADIVYTDIKTYINGVPVESFNIGGQTIVNFSNFAVFGGISYDNDKRTLDLDIKDGLNYKIGLPESYSEYSPSGLYFKRNSADGIQVRWTAKNNTNKQIKYYTAHYYMFDSAGEFAYDEITNEPKFTYKIIGPVEHGDWILNFTDKYEAEAYSATCYHLFLHKIFVEYMDGTSETIYYGQIGEEKTGEFAL